MRILAVLAHPKKDSHNGRLFYTIVEHLKKNLALTVDVLDLYDHAETIPFFPADKKSLEQSAFYLDNKERFMAADRLFIVYPVYWYSVPGILKCWFDLITNYAWQINGSYRVKPLHHITKALVVNTAGMPTLFRWLLTRNSATEMVKESLKFFCIKKYYFHEINSIYKLSEEGFLKHINAVVKKSDWLIEK